MRRYLPFLILISFLWLIITQMPGPLLDIHSTKGTSTSTSVTITVTIPQRPAPPPPPTPPGGGGGPIIIPAPLPTKVIFKGFSSPNAFIYIYKDSKLAATLTATSKGTFYYELSGLYGKIYDFTLAAEDQEKRPTMTMSIKVSVLEGAITTIDNIFLPPTIELSQKRIVRGDRLSIFGATYPKSTVTTIIVPGDITQQAIAEKNGYWNILLDTKLISEGSYFAAASAQTLDGLQSPQTQILQFTVIPKARECRGPDINLNGKVDIYDFSILMFWWHAKKIIHPCVDINKDGKVDLIDFSIMMYYWNKKYD